MPYMALSNMLFQTFSIFTDGTTIHTGSQYQTTGQNHPMTWFHNVFSSLILKGNNYNIDSFAWISQSRVPYTLTDAELRITDIPLEESLKGLIIKLLNKVERTTRNSVSIYIKKISPNFI